MDGRKALNSVQASPAESLGLQANLRQVGNDL
jgi:hypothetical protein